MPKLLRTTFRTCLVVLMAATDASAAEFHSVRGSVYFQSDRVVFWNAAKPEEMLRYRIQGKEVLRLATGDQRAAAITDGGSLLVVDRDRGDWKSLVPPPELKEELQTRARAKEAQPFVRVSDEYLVLLTGKKIWSRPWDGAWNATPIPRSKKKPFPGTRIPQDVLLFGDELLIGFNMGEWGGAAVTVKLSSGTITRSELRVANFARSNGRVFCVYAGGHMGRASSSLSERSDGKWKIVSQVSWRTEGSNKNRRNWPYDRARFISAHALSESKEKRESKDDIAILADTGLAVAQGGKWRWVDGPWAKDPELNTPHSFWVVSDEVILLGFEGKAYLWSVDKGTIVPMRIQE